MKRLRWLGAASVLLLACSGAVETTSAKGKKTRDDGAAGSGGNVAATVGDLTLTMDEVDARAKEANLQVYQQLYDARKQVVDQMVQEELVRLEAEARGLTSEQLMQQEVGSQVPEVTAEAVQAFFDQNRARLGGRTLEQAEPQIRQFLSGQNRANTVNTLISSLKKKHPVKISLDPPRMEVKIAANDPVKGKVGAPIQIVEFSDFQ